MEKEWIRVPTKKGFGGRDCDLSEVDEVSVGLNDSLRGLERCGVLWRDMRQGLLFALFRRFMVRTKSGGLLEGGQRLEISLMANGSVT